MTRTEPPQMRYRLSLFPLPVVLFPGAPLPLHVFELRYQELVRDCLDSDRRFGMVYHDWDRSGPFLSEEGRVGCVAEIQEHEALPDGRSLISVRGTERFRIADGIESEKQYFEALVTPYGDESSQDGEALISRRLVSAQLFREVVDSLPSPPEGLPSFPADDDISFPLAQTIQIDPEWQQGLLELRDEAERLDQLDQILRRALGQGF